MSASNETPKKRSPVERAIVWGGILILVGLVIYEYRPRSAYDGSLERLGNAYDEADATDKPLTPDRVEELMAGYVDLEVNDKLATNRQTATREEKYIFKSLLGGTREVYVYYGTPGADGTHPSVLLYKFEPIETSPDQGFTGSEIHQKLDALTDENDQGEEDEEEGGRPGAGGAQSDTKPDAEDSTAEEPATEEPATEEPAGDDAASDKGEPAADKE